MYLTKQIKEAMKIVNQVFSRVQCDRATHEQLKGVENILNSALQIPLKEKRKAEDGDIPKDVSGTV